MKMKTLLAMGLCAAIGFTGLTATTASAQEGHEHKAGEKAKIPDTVEGIWKEIKELILDSAGIGTPKAQFGTGAPEVSAPPVANGKGALPPEDLAEMI